VKVRTLVGAAVLLLAVPGEGAIVRSVTIEGATAFSSREINEMLTLRGGALFDSARASGDCRAVEREYRTRGFLASGARWDPPSFTADSSFVDLTLRIVEGKETIVGRIDLTGATRLSTPEILERFDLVPGAPLDQAKLERDIGALLERYEKSGFPFTRCDIASLDVRAGESVDSVLVLLRVDEGRPMTIDEIRVEGNKETSASVIVRETRIEPGEIFQPAKIDAIRPRLNRLNIFASVAEPELYLREGKGGVLIRVQEGSTSTFDGILGYIPSTQPGQGGYLTGLASVSMRNLFGTGRKLSLRWAREDRYSQEIGVRYLEPWLLGAPVNLGGGFLQRQQDTAYVRRVVDGRSELMLSEEVSLSFVLESEKVIPSGDSISSGVIGSSSTTAGIEVAYDTRDDIYSPTRGARYRTDYHYGKKTVGVIPSYWTGRVDPGGTVQRVGVDLDFYVAPFRKQVIAVALHGREIRSGQVQEGEMYRFGGANTLRGYRENQFLGSRVAWTNAEYRFILARRSFVYGFFDTGYASRPADDLRGLPASELFRYGYGIGIRLETGLGIMGVSFAFGQGDTFGTAKIHFGIINEF
jgi:outer membrane protein assembly factor BamA